MIIVSATRGDDIIIDVEVSPHATNPTSAVLVRKPIDDVSVGRLVCSSGTPSGSTLRSNRSRSRPDKVDRLEVTLHRFHVGRFEVDTGVVDADLPAHRPVQIDRVLLPCVESQTARTDAVLHTRPVVGSPSRLRVRGNRLLAPNAECMTLVGDQTVEQDAYTAASTSTELLMPVPAGATTGDLVRVRVNGAESLDDAGFP